MPNPSVLIADDHPLTLAGIRATLEPHCEIIAVVTDGQTMVDTALRLKPDVIVLDISMPILNGIDAARQVRKSWPQAKFVFVTVHTNPSYVAAALEAGASGYVVKSAAGSELLQAVKEVAAGRTWITRGLGGDVVGRSTGTPGEAHALHLSPRERQSLQLIAEGRAGKEIAHIMNISVKTVAFHRENLKRKLGLTTTAELTRYALEQGIIQYAPPID